MTNGEKQKAIDALKISAPVMAVTQEEFNDYIKTINKIMDWLEQMRNATPEERESVDACIKSISKPTGIIFGELEPCEDTVSRQAVINAINKEMNNDHLSIFAPYVRCKDAVRKLPHVTPQPKTGRWIESSDGIGRWWECSQCECSQCESHGIVYRSE